MKTCIVLLADGFEETEAVVPSDILRRAGADVRLISVTGASLLVNGAHAVKIEADAAVCDIVSEIKRGNVPDAVFCPGGMPGSTNLAKSANAAFVLHAVKKAGGTIAAICAAPAVVLAPLGLLGGKSFTCYPGMESDAEEASPEKPKKYCADSVVLDGNVLTSRGPATAAQLGFALAELLCGKDAADSVKKAMLF